AHVATLHGRGLTALVQPYLHQIDEYGEKALVFVAGEGRHAIRKRPGLNPGAPHDPKREAPPRGAPPTPPPPQLAPAHRAPAAVPGADQLLSARADLVSAGGRDPVLMELELVEPNLFLRFFPGSVPGYLRAVFSRMPGY